MALQPDSIESLLSLRKLTRSVSDLLRERMSGYLATLSPLLRPRSVLGEYVQGSSKEPAKNADAAFKDFTTLREQLVSAKPFSLRTPLNQPLVLGAVSLEITPLEYLYSAGDVDGRQVLVRTPLKWVLSYTDYSPMRFKELLASRHRSAEELHDFLIHYLVLHVVVSRQQGVTDILRALQFPVTTERMAEFGDLPITCVTCTVSTRRPSDDIIVRSTELSGMDAFEEVVQLEDIAAIPETLKQELLALVNAHGLAV